MALVRCSDCQRSFQDEETLLVHKEFDVCQSTTCSSLSNEYLCPICDRSFLDTEILQIHLDEEHLFNESDNKTTTTSDHLFAQTLERQERMRQQHGNEKQAASTIADEDLYEDEDMMIARLLQEEENAQSFEEFKNRYGGSSRSFQDRARSNLDNLYRKKMISTEKYNEYQRDLEVMITQPIERRESRTPNLIPMLAKLPMGPLIDRQLCKPGCDHIGATWLDQGWACGYKNFQMLLSSLRHDPQISKHLFGNDGREQEIPSVHHLQTLIESAWSAGFDSQGRDQFSRTLINSTKWIGPTEIMACLSNLKIKTELYEFHQPKSLPKNVAYDYMFRWVQNYFQDNRTNIIHPLYLQHEGHSRTIVGFEQFKNRNLRLLIFDPSTSKNEISNFFQNPTAKAHLFRRNLQSFQKSVYQILVVRGLLQENEREESKRIRSIKIPVPNS